MSRKVLYLAVLGIATVWPATKGDLEREFSIAGPEYKSSWEFGWKGELKGVFARYAHRFQSEFWGAKVIVHSKTGGSVSESPQCCPLVMKNVDDKPLKGAPAFKLEPGRILMHPGPNGEYSVARWTCPAAAHYTIEATFATVGYGTSDVHVAKGSDILGSASLNGVRAKHQFYFAGVECHSGEIFEFLVGYGDNRNFTSDSTAVRVVISDY